MRPGSWVMLLRDLLWTGCDKKERDVVREN